MRTCVKVFFNISIGLLFVLILSLKESMAGMESTSSKGCEPAQRLLSINDQILKIYSTKGTRIPSEVKWARLDIEKTDGVHNKEEYCHKVDAFNDRVNLFLDWERF